MTSFSCLLKNKQYHVKQQASSFHLNSHTLADSVYRLWSYNNLPAELRAVKTTALPTIKSATLEFHSQTWRTSSLNSSTNKITASVVVFIELSSSISL